MKTQNQNIIPASAGFVFNSAQHGAFDPDGKVAVSPSPDEVDAHNRAVAKRSLAHMAHEGRGILYLFTVVKPSQDGGNPHMVAVGTWDGSTKINCTGWRSSWHNIAGKRLDLWFNFEGDRWHGVNIGDNDIVRVRRVKP